MLWFKLFLRERFFWCLALWEFGESAGEKKTKLFPRLSILLGKTIFSPAKYLVTHGRDRHCRPACPIPSFPSPFSITWSREWGGSFTRIPEWQGEEEVSDGAAFRSHCFRLFPVVHLVKLSSRRSISRELAASLLPSLTGSPIFGECAREV